jgi:hypothetical protein
LACDPEIEFIQQCADRFPGVLTTFECVNSDMLGVKLDTKEPTQPVPNEDHSSSFSQRNIYIFQTAILILTLLSL